MDTKRLRQRVLDLAIHGKLVPQNPQDEPASELLKHIAEEKERLIKDGKIKKSKKKANEDIDEVPFEVPQGWVWCKLEDICDSCLGKMLDKNRHEGVYQKYLRNVNVRWYDFALDDLLEMPFKEDEEDRFSIIEGDLVLCEGGEPGRCAIWTGKPIKFQKALHRLRCLNTITTLYIQRVIHLYSCNGTLEKYYTGSTIKHLTGESLSVITIPLPPLAEQHRIVSEVEKYFSLIDILEESENDLQQSIQKARSKILDSAISGKLIKIEGNYKEVSLNSLAVDSADGPFGSNLKREHYTTNKEVRIIQLSNIGEDGWRDENTKYTTFEHLPNIARSEVHPGDIVIAKMMPAGRAILCPTGDPKYVLSSDAVKFVLKEGIYNKYVLYAINSSHFREQVYDNVQGVTRVRTSLKKLREYTIPIPSLSEQHKIVERIEMLNQQLDNIAEALK